MKIIAPLITHNYKKHCLQVFSLMQPMVTKTSNIKYVNINKDIVTIAPSIANVWEMRVRGGRKRERE